MAYRHLARSLVLQTLFSLDFTQFDENYAKESLGYVINEFGPGIEQPDFLEYLILGVLRKRVILDEIIEKAAPEWPVDKINAVDRNILRLGLFELLFGDYNLVPPKVAINESIELAKSFGGESSGRFVNGVLGAVYKEIGEPGKEQTSKKKEMTQEEVDALPIEEKAGAVVFARLETGIKFAMVHDIFGYWTLSKGSLEEGETADVAVIREVQEEIGVTVSIVKELGQNEYIANHPEKGRIRKRVTYFLAESPYNELKLEQDSGGLDDARWFTPDEIATLRMYDDVTGLIATSLEFLVS